MVLPYLCDTNIISELMRPQPNPEVKAWLLRQERIALSVITVEELHFDLRLKNLPKKREWLDRFVAACTQVLSIDTAIAMRAGQMRAEQALRGQTRTQADLLIAATAVTHNCVLATRNTRDFEGTNVPLFNPFDTVSPL